jgi:nitrogen fixation protein NifB
MSHPDPKKHPCFNVHAKGKCGRVHLPIAPECNIKCNYCNRKYDCVNESRPGVTSSVLTPSGAVQYLDEVLKKMPQITVAGIAGPGDAFADPPRTLETLRLVREKFPEMLLCLATNGLNIGPYIQELAEIGVSHVTVTLNAVDPEIGKRIYAWVRDGKRIYRGEKAAQLMIDRGLAAISDLKKHGIIVKVNTIVIPGINDDHVAEVAERIRELGADIHNCMPMFPNAGTPFADIPEPTPEMITKLRSQVETIIPQMTHCTRCRADAIGLLGDDRSHEFREQLADCSGTPSWVNDVKPYVAVATLEGMLVNRHLGEANQFQIWEKAEAGFRLVENRKAPIPGGGSERWHHLANVLKDCRAVLVSGLGEAPRKILEAKHITPVEMNGLIQAGLESIYNGGNTTMWKVRKVGCGKGQGCSGNAEGCG